jgi:hypothetical protein
MSASVHAFYVSAASGQMNFPYSISVGGNSTQQYISAAYIDLSNGVGIGFQQQGGSSRKSFTSTGTQLTHYINGTAAGSWTFNAPSDERFKRNVRAMECNPLAELLKVKLVSFEEDFFRQPEWQETEVSCGFSAQQLLTVIPEAVVKAEYFHGEEDKRINPIDDGIMLSLDIVALVARCVGAIQQLQQEVSALKEARAA